jgi:hypothetical protein
MTNEQLDTLERYAKTHNDTAELEVISLARIGLADLDVCLMRQSAANPDDVIEAETKLEQLRIDHLTRKDG